MKPSFILAAIAYVTLNGSTCLAEPKVTPPQDKSAVDSSKEATDQTEPHGTLPKTQVDKDVAKATKKAPSKYQPGD